MSSSNKDLNEIIEEAIRNIKAERVMLGDHVYPLTIGDNVVPLTVGDFPNNSSTSPLTSPVQPRIGPAADFDEFFKDYLNKKPSISLELDSSEEVILEAVKKLGFKKVLKSIPRKELLDFLKEDVPED